MSETPPSKVFMFDGGDPEMHGAHEKTRATFRYFWRELSWEYRRIVPGLDLACVKAPFSDNSNAPASPDPKVKHMWLNDIAFDGKMIRGVLLNAPNWLKTVKQGDAVRFRLEEISDWMYAIRGTVYGGYTVNLLRSRMSQQERAGHDAAWGLNFGDPHTIRVVPEQKKPAGLMKFLFRGSASAEIGEHPMSENMAPSLKAQLKLDPSMLTAKDAQGWTLLHHMALAGSTAAVQILLEAGADRTAVTDHGMTALQLAKSLGWEKAVALLSPATGKG